MSGPKDCVVAEDLHDVVVGEVEEKFEFGLGSAGEAGVDEEGGFGFELLGGCVVGRERKAPGGAGEDVAAVQRGFVDPGELGGLGAELVEQGLPFGERGCEV